MEGTAMETCTAWLREDDGTWVRCTHPPGHGPIRVARGIHWGHEHYEDDGPTRWNDDAAGAVPAEDPDSSAKQEPSPKYRLVGQPDPELAAIRQVFEALSVLEEHEQCVRVIRWAADRFNVTAWH